LFSSQIQHSPGAAVEAVVVSTVAEVAEVSMAVAASMVEEVAEVSTVVAASTVAEVAEVSTVVAATMEAEEEPSMEGAVSIVAAEASTVAVPMVAVVFGVDQGLVATEWAAVRTTGSARRAV
jgi:hypothetical protein